MSEVFGRLIYMSVCSLNMQVLLLAMIRLLWVYVHCAILETALVLLGSVAVGLICRGYV